MAPESKKSDQAVGRVRWKPTVMAKQAVIIVMMTCLFFVLVEGVSSTTIGFAKMFRKPAPKSVHYDESLGWVGIPGAYLPDRYGPGRYIRINTRGFRDDNETDAAMSGSKVRAICSGDSFTFGQGVANDRAWCHLLERVNDRLETVNLGQNGYGVDQMYLRYLRDGIVLEHSIHLFAFIYGDLSRMRYQDHSGHGRPALKIEDDDLVVENVPVPRLRWSASRAVNRADFRSLDFARRVLRRLFKRQESPSGTMLASIEKVGPVAAKIFETLDELGREKNIVQVFVYLPGQPDLREDLKWRFWLAETSGALDLEFIDLTPDLSAVPAGTAGRFFIDPWRESKGHYTEAGNEWVAEILNKRLLEIPQIRALLLKRKPGAAPTSHSKVH
jgi:hypothetical protein